MTAPEPTYRINIAAEMSGVSENLIRAWERRYGVPKPIRTASGYRAYARSEIEILKRLKQLTQQGVSIAEAVLLVPSLTREVKALLAREEQGQPQPVVDYGPWRDELLRAAQRFDQHAIDASLDEAMHGRPPVAFFDELVAPFLKEVGDRWHTGALTVAEEHLLSNAVRQRLMALLNSAPRRARRHVVCACLPTEQHDVGLLGAALRFRHAGWKVTYLGACTPLEQLARTAKALKPDVVAVSAVRDGRELKGLRKAIPEGRIIVGGGAAKGRLPGLHVIETAADWSRLFEELP
ncbi:MAG: cobalamin B12-binding domain-containing protein [Archangium sp.]|nr:cobalamin B12-binding domain-containing protein [Archangium sp.]